MPGPVGPGLFSATAHQVMRDLATHAATGVTVVCGFPATRKTTAARLLAELVDPVVLDKDTFAPRPEESVTAELTGNPFDRDSDLYRRVVSPHLYAALVQQAVTIARRCPVVVDTPFLGYITAADQLGQRLSDYIRAIAGGDAANRRCGSAPTPPGSESRWPCVAPSAISPSSPTGRATVPACWTPAWPTPTPPSWTTSSRSESALVSDTGVRPPVGIARRFPSALTTPYSSTAPPSMT
ncbi:AAA family ATPase [Nocardia salmonicida]|uniref:AAA family ATPase n=1 Tax=Nocardia salmonicida TaxID=53431 RepID=UPI003CF76BF9